MLFLYRPRQTYMPYRLPRNVSQQQRYNQQLQQRFDSTRRLPPPTPAAQAPARDTITQLKELAELHDSGALTDAEFAAAKAKLLGTNSSTS